jgi:CRISPR-associated endonuclease/helicase Cas3
VDYAVDGHHTGLPDAGDLRQSLLKMADPILTREHTGCAESVGELTVRLIADGVQLPSAPARRQEDSFAAALRTRMLFSCLVDADFLDTEKHFDHTAAAQRVVPSIQPERTLGLVQAALAAKPADGPVNLLRRRLLADCLSASEKPPGLFTLTAPTGSGKTLASLAFALRHIAHHNSVLPAHDPRRFRRVIVVILYTSTIEQTARVFREILEAEFGVDYVLEHHSAVAPHERKEDA